MTKPTKYYTDPAGETVPAQYVKPYDKKRDRIANRIAKDWQDMQKKLAALKEKTMTNIEALQEAAASAADVPELGGKKGNLQFRSFDGSVTVSLSRHLCTEFDERLPLAQQLIMEAVHEMAADVKNADLVEIATKAFQPRRSGNLDMQRIRDLRTYNVKHPKWRKACDIISDCERAIGHREYISVTVRSNPDENPKAIILDIAKA